jgi:hypothetical protein
MFCGRADHLDEFCFRCKRIEKKRLDYARNSYHDEFIDILSCSYSQVPLRSYSRALLRSSFHALPRVSHGPNHCLYGFGSRENHFVPRHFGYGPRHHRSDHFPRSSDFSAGASYTHFEPRHLDGPHSPIVVHVPLSQIVKCKEL